MTYIICCRKEVKVDLVLLWPKTDPRRAHPPALEMIHTVLLGQLCTNDSTSSVVISR